MAEKNKAIGLQASPFEAQFFGGPVFRLTNPSFAKEAVSVLKSEGAALCSCRLPDGDLQSEKLAQAGFRLVETLVTLSKPLSNAKSFARSPMVRRADIQDILACRHIAATALTHDRYHADPFLLDEAADALKAAWVENSVNGRAESVFVWGGEEAPLRGFCALLLHENVGAIDLIAVDPSFQGTGVGRALIEASEIELKGKATRLTVGTQALNEQSIAFYKRLGFSEQSRAQTWHWTPE